MQVLSDFDIFAVVGANKPLQLVDFRASVKEDGVILIRFEAIHGVPIISGICIRRAPQLAGNFLLKSVAYKFISVLNISYTVAADYKFLTAVSRLQLGNRFTGDT